MPTFQHILVPTDFGDISSRAVDRAIDLARDLDAKVTLLHVTPMPPYYYAAYAEGLAWPTDELEVAARSELDAALAAAKERYAKVDAVLLTGAPRVQIVEAIGEQKADLVVMGTHGRRGFKRFMLGGVTERFMRMARCHVLLVSSSAESTGDAPLEKASS